MIIEKRYRVEIGDYRQLVVMLVGCGGTGSFAALHLARLAYVAKQKNISLKLVFVDPDTVEEKNIGRQNFAPAEIGLNKAYALAGRYNLAFGLEIAVVAGQFKQSLASEWRYNRYNGDILLLVGAVDNADARREIARVSTHRQVWWLDAGNDLHSGQVLIGNDRKVTIDGTGLCTHLPRPSVQEPELMKEPPPVVQTDEQSCAARLAAETQSLMINQAMGGWLGLYAYRLLLGRDLDIQATYIDLAGGSVRSVPVTGQRQRIQKAKETAQPVPPPAGWNDDMTGVFNDEEIEAITANECPECGGDLVRGRDVVDDEEVGILFCPQCQFRINVEGLDNLTERV